MTGWWRSRATLLDDCGGIVIGWLTRLIVSMTVLAVVAIDTVSIGIAHVGSVDDANRAAQAASVAWQSTHNIERAFAAAQETAGGGEEVLTKGFSADRDGTVHLTLQKTAKTVVIRHFKASAGWAVVTVEASAKALTS